tara:strand:+ start:145 stop:396 length:252 start_codon:yes stop_codon:yes gene_type:complete
MSLVEELGLGFKDVDSIYESTSKRWDNEKKVSSLLEIGAVIEANLGIDSTAAERKEAKRQQKYIYKIVRKLDSMLGDLLMRLI